MELKLVTVKEIAEILRIKPSTVYQWAELGQIPCIRLNSALRFDLKDIQIWISDCKKDANSGYNPFTQARSPKKGVNI